MTRIARAEHPASLPAYELADVQAIKAVHRGDASPEQQQRAVEWILTKVSRIGALCYHTEPISMAFDAGRCSVGKHLLHFITTPIEAFKE